jgi:hypothetical protein
LFCKADDPLCPSFAGIERSKRAAGLFLRRPPGEPGYQARHPVSIINHAKPRSQSLFQRPAAQRESKGKKTTAIPKGMTVIFGSG